MAVYTTQPNRAERISQGLSSLATIAKQIINLKKLEAEDKEEKTRKVIADLAPILSAQGMGAVPSESISQLQSVPQLPSSGDELLGPPGPGSLPLPEGLAPVPSGMEGISMFQLPKVPYRAEPVRGQPEYFETVEKEEELKQKYAKKTPLERYLDGDMSPEEEKAFETKYGKIQEMEQKPSTKGKLTEGQFGTFENTALNNAIKTLRETHPKYSKKNFATGEYEFPIPEDVLEKAREKEYQRLITRAKNQGAIPAQSIFDIQSLDDLSKEDAQKFLDWISSLQLQSQ